MSPFRSLLLIVVLLFVQTGFAQDFDAVAFILTTKNGKNVFRIGEAIPIELRFVSSIPGRYEVLTNASHRVFLNSNTFDQFIVEPAQDTVDPLRGQVGMPSAVSVMSDPRMPLLDQPVIVERLLNEWLSFRNAGRYRITAKTTRLRIAENSSPPIPLQSNAIEIELIRPEQGWADTQLKDAVAVLERGESDSRKYYSRAQPEEDKIINAARILRFLNTREAALALVRFFEHAPPPAQYDLVAGLYGSPYLNEIISALEEIMKSPTFVPTSQWRATLSDLVMLRNMER
jgi:hypothetical protein